jgi:hypothetical protein
MADVRTDLYTVYRRLSAALNASVSSTFTAVLDDPRRSPGELFTSIQAADDELCTLIAETEGHGYRPFFLTDSAALSHNDQLPDRLGSIVQVKIKHVSGGSYRPAKFDKDLTIADIDRWRENTGSLYGAGHNAANSSLSGFCIILGDGIYFTGYEAVAKIAVYTRRSRDVTDGAMTTGSKNLTSATAVFVAGDVSGAALVDGAGISGVPLVSRIDTRTDGTTVILRDANASGGNITSKTVTIASLQTPQPYEFGVLALAVEAQVKKGDNPPFAELWLRAADRARARVRANEKTIPNVEMAQAA